MDAHRKATLRMIPAVLLLLAGCAGETSVGQLVGARWTAADGQTVTEEVVNVIRGPEHCDWQSSVWLHLGWPPGTKARTVADVRQYVRDPRGVLPRPVKGGTLSVDIRLPPEAEPVGFRSGQAELWFGSDRGAEVLYVKLPDRVERWPRSREAIACA
ncbi:hypothetical protein BH20ACT7_BH20ACT7_11990 [soil metagenome]